jgi:hypothetical protein
MTMTREEALAQVLRVAADMQDRDWVPAGAVEVHEWAGELMAAHEAIAALGGGEVVEYRMWDSQWVNVVNHERAYGGWEMEAAIHHAVKLTEQAMAKNIRDGKWPPARVTHPLPPSPQGETK